MTGQKTTITGQKTT